MRRCCKILIFLVAVVVFSGFVVWAETPPPPMQQAYAAKSNANVTVSQGQWLVFEPKATNYSAGFVFYPGGRVNYLA